MPFDDVVFLLDVDNTLLDGDRIVADLRQRLERDFGADGARRYWSTFEVMRAELGYVDYLGALQRYRTDTPADGRSDPALLQMAGFLLDYPFRERLYPRALDVIERLRTLGRTVLLTDGDVVYQPRKLQAAGLWRAVAGRVLIYARKEQVLDAVQRRYPARHYVMVDDKLRILTAIKTTWRERVTTIFARQGHYALDAGTLAPCPAPDRTIDCIADLLALDDDALTGTAALAVSERW